MAPSAVTPMKSKTGALTAPAAAGISLAPSTFSQGGGLIDDVDVEVVDAQFVMFDYNGKVAVAVPALGLELKELGDEGKVHQQYFSCGDAAYFAPSDDGNSLIPTGDRTSINTTSKAGMFLISLVNAGVPETLLASGNIKDIVGMKFHVNQIAAPKRPGLQNQKEGATDLIVTKLISLPGEKAPARTGLGAKTPPANMAAPKPNGAAAAATQGTGGTVDEALASATVEAIIGVLAENDGTVLLKDVSAKLFKAVDKGNPLRASITKLAFDKEWLKSVSGEAGFNFDGTTLSM